MTASVPSGRAVTARGQRGQYSQRREGELRPILQRAAVGQVDDKGTLHFEGLVDEQTRFVDGLDTLDELQTECAADTVPLKY